MQQTQTIKKEWLMDSDKRENGELFYKFSDKVNDEMKNKLFLAGFEICDFYYNVAYEFEHFIRCNLKEVYNDNWDECEEAFREQIEGDTYNCDLLQWFSKTVGAEQYINDVLQTGAHNDIYLVLQMAQVTHYHAALDTVLEVFKEYYTGTDQ